MAQPKTEHTLNIFEPRYRKLYNDILFSGSRRFAVCAFDSETGSLSEVGSVFYLKDLKEVSEQTGDAVKYVCEHEVVRTTFAFFARGHDKLVQVIGRVRLTKILNPSAWRDASTYLKVFQRRGGGAAWAATSIGRRPPLA